jgi:hypothetical protein
MAENEQDLFTVDLLEALERNLTTEEQKILQRALRNSVSITAKGRRKNEAKKEEENGGSK